MNSNKLPVRVALRLVLPLCAQYLSHCLCICAENPLVPRAVVIEATMARLMNFECSPDELEKRLAILPARLQPRPKRSLVFEFNKDSQEFFHGIVNYIATGYGKGDWKNPHIAGRVKVHSSSLAKGTNCRCGCISSASMQFPIR
jgi:hypothetical protein